MIAMIGNHDELDVTVTLVSPVGLMVEADEFQGFVDLRKHPSWWSGVEWILLKSVTGCMSWFWVILGPLLG
ncbi:hypothetical protein [Streptomyces sviceus]|uniref:hypothetical protein n=1 Tax=Streptomyces sviceus TaxID=285530 RepID=UPI00332476FD